MITKLEVENFRRIKTISIEPKEGATIIAGENDAGKSSLIDAIRAAIGGKKHRPSEPIRKGSKKATVLLETEEVVVSLTFTQKGERLKVEGKDGTRWGSPQLALNKWWGDLSFDPLEFTRLKGQQQAEVLRKLVGLDFTKLEEKRVQLYEKRSAANREAKRLEGAISQLPKSTSIVAKELISLDDLLKEQMEAETKNRIKASEESRLAMLRQQRKDQQSIIANIEQQLESAKKKLTRINEEGKRLRDQLETMETIDVMEINDRIRTIESTNQAIREHQERDRLNKERSDAVNLSEKLTAEIEAIDEEKTKAIESAKYPVEGMTVTDDGVMLDGHPFDQASQSDQLRTSFAVGLALNPGKLMISKDGSLLGDEKLAMLDAMAKKHNAQIFVEVVGDRKGATLVVEDGQIKE